MIRESGLTFFIERIKEDGGSVIPRRKQRRMGETGRVCFSLDARQQNYLLLLDGGFFHFTRGCVRV